MSFTLGGRDRQAFPEFYEEYDGRVMRAASAPIRPVVTGPIAYRGHAELGRDIANLKAGLAGLAGADGPDGPDGVEGFLPVVAPASALPNARDDYYDDEETLLFALADALGEEYRAIVDAGLILQVDDAFLPYMYEKLVPPMTLAEYRGWAKLRIAALNRALDGLPPERTRYHICWGSWNGPARLRRADEGHRRSGARGECRHLRLRGRQPAPRARVAGLEDRQAAGGKKADAGCHRALHQRGRAPRAGGRTPDPLRRRGRARERGRRHRLRLLPEPARRARPPQHHVGQAALALRGRRDRFCGALGGGSGGVRMKGAPPMFMRAVHPGEILRDELEELGITPTEFARQIAVPPNRIARIVAGKRSITGDTALRLGHWFGAEPQFWLNLQSQYDLVQAHKAAGAGIRRLPTRAAMAG